MKNQKSKKIVSWIVNIIVLLILLLVMMVTISAITSKKTGFSNFFGVAFYAVKTNSMQGEAKDNFERGDIIVIDVLKTDAERGALKKGDIITFMDNIDNMAQPNSHRIVNVMKQGNQVLYQTKGDNVDRVDTVWVTSNNVLGVFKYKISNVGNFILFLNTFWGFFACVVIPVLLILAYCIFNVIRNMKKYSKDKISAEAIAGQNQDALREQIRQELLRDMQKKDNPSDDK